MVEQTPATVEGTMNLIQVVMGWHYQELDKVQARVQALEAGFARCQNDAQHLLQAGPEELEEIASRYRELANQVWPLFDKPPAE